MRGFQDSKGSKVRKETSLWWILEDPKDIGVCRAPLADQGSQEGEDLMDPQESLET